MSRVSIALGALALALCCESCVRVSWSRVDVCRSIAPDLHAEMAPHATTLAQCLDELGAPLFVWEVSDDEYGLAYGWDHHVGWGVNVSVPLTQEISGSFDYEDLDSELNGVVFIFDRDDRLQRKRSGFLRDLVGDNARRRPALIEESAESEESETE